MMRGASKNIVWHKLKSGKLMAKRYYDDEIHKEVCKKLDLTKDEVWLNHIIRTTIGMTKRKYGFIDFGMAKK